MPQLVNDHLIQKYGLQSLVDCYMQGIIKAVKKWQHKSVWVRMFGRMTGILEQERCVGDSYQRRRLLLSPLRARSTPCRGDRLLTA